MKTTALFISILLTLALGCLHQDTGPYKANSTPDESAAKLVDEPQATSVDTGQAAPHKKEPPQKALQIDRNESTECCIREKYGIESTEEIGALMSNVVVEFYDLFSAELGIVVRRLQDGTTVFAENEDVCFIPASMTKIVLASALIRALDVKSPVGDLEKVFVKETTRLGWADQPFYNGLGWYLRKMNTYGFAEAPQANRAADRAGEFLQALLPTDDGRRRSLTDLLTAHLEEISWRMPCNRISAASGLSPNNRLTPFQVADSLYYLKHYDFFIDSLPSPGEGTLRDRLLELPGESRFKTGSMRRSGVACLAGYLTSRDMFFVIMVNGIDSTAFDDVIDWLDRMVLAMAGIQA
jgi:hypothetical protein